jgi:hemerythrin superfamily protein
MSMTSEQVSSTASRLLTAAVSQVDAVSILREDHRRVDELFKQFDKSRGDEQRGGLASRICSELLIHAHVEEEIFYPALREALGDDILMDEADVEHAVAGKLVLEIMHMRPGDKHYCARVKVLGEYVRHHVQEEQNRMFSKARQARLDMRGLGGQIVRRRDELKRATSYARWPTIITRRTVLGEANVINFRNV